MFKKKQYIHVLHSLLGCFLLGSTIIVQTGCDMIEYHPYDLNIEGETNIKYSPSVPKRHLSNTKSVELQSLYLPEVITLLKVIP